MSTRIDTVNGKEVPTFIKNTDYFEMSDGVFWTVDALMKKYDSGRSTIYNKARDNNIPTMKVLGIVTFKDSDKFKKAYNGKIENLKGAKVTSYAELHRSVESLIKDTREFISVSYEWHNKTTLEIRKVNDGYMVNMDRLNQKLNRLSDNISENNRLLNEILNYLTTTEMEKEMYNDAVKDNCFK